MRSVLFAPTSQNITDATVNTQLLPYRCLGQTLPEIDNIVQFRVGALLDRFWCTNNKSSKCTLNALRFLQCANSTS